MTTNNDILEQIDNALKDKKPTELYMIYMAIAIVFGFISYQFIYPVTDSNLKKIQKKVKVTKNRLNKEISYLKSKTVNGDHRFYIKKLQKDIKELEENLEKTKYENTYVDNKLKELSYLLFNDENWAKFLDNISYLAKKYHVTIEHIKNKFNDINMHKVEQILEVEVAAKGRFKDMMKFINAIEESKLVVDIHSLHMESKKTLNTKFKIAVWGMKY